jgi:hypothetical protein
MPLICAYAISKCRLMLIGDDRYQGRRSRMDHAPIAGSWRLGPLACPGRGFWVPSRNGLTSEIVGVPADGSVSAHRVEMLREATWSIHAWVALADCWCTDQSGRGPHSP